MSNETLAAIVAVAAAIGKVFEWRKMHKADNSKELGELKELIKGRFEIVHEKIDVLDLRIARVEEKYVDPTPDFRKLQ